MIEFNMDELIRKAKNGDSESAYFLGAYYKFKNNIEESKRWCTPAAKQGHLMASSLLEELSNFEEDSSFRIAAIY